jgi:hypothetical protein
MKSTHPVSIAVLGIPKKDSRTLVLRKGGATCLFDRLNAFCSVGLGSREDNTDRAGPSLPQVTVKYIERAVWSFSGSRILV